MSTPLRTLIWSYMRFQSWIVMSGDLVKRWMHSLTKNRSLKQKS